MREIVRKILEGNYIVPSAGLEFSCKGIYFDLSCDCDYEGSFVVCSDNTDETEGLVSTSDYRMELLNSKIYGSNTEIFYHFHGDLCKPGDVIKGSFSIISNRGEYQLPFEVQVVPAGIETSIGTISDLNSFCNLAKSAWDEALDVFYSDNFSKIVLQSDEDSLPIYEALRIDTHNAQNMEEFLISTGKKQKQEYILSKREITHNLNVREYGDSLIEREIEIIKNGWGYTHLDISFEGDFVFTERKILTEEDFNGNVCVIKLFIDSRKCHKGKNEGKFIFSNNFLSIELPVCVKSSFDLTVRKIARTRALLLTKMTEAYVSHGIEKLGDVEFHEIVGRTVEQLVHMDESDVFAKLLHAEILAAEKRLNEASWLLDQAAELLEDKKNNKMISQEALLRAYGYHWTISSNIKQDREFTKVAADKVESLLKKNPSDWQLVAMALKLPTTHTASSYTKWKVLEDAFVLGARSPIIYLEGIKILNENPTVAKGLSGFTLQVVYFGAKNRYIESKCFDHIVNLVTREKGYTRLLFKTLELIYMDYKDVSVVSAICSFLIKGGRRDKISAEWYRRGIDAQLKINGLFEYYIQSIDIKYETDIPIMVIMYFSYQNNLDYERQAYLYHYIIEHRDEFQDIFDSSRSNIEAFAVNQLSQGRINKDLAYIYDYAVKPEMLTRQMAISMAEVVFTNVLTFKSDRYKKVYVYHKDCNQVWEYRIRDKECVLPLYGKSYVIVLEDENGFRYVDSGEYEQEKLMHIGKYLKPLSDLVWDNERLNLFIVGAGQSAITVTNDNISRFVQISESDMLRKDIRQETIVTCLEYYSIHEDTDAVERCFAKLDFNSLNAKQLDRLFPILLKFEKYDVLEDWIRKYSPYFTSASNIKRYLEKVLTPQFEYMKTKSGDLLNYSAIYVFNHTNPGSLITGFLAQNYFGLTTQLRDVWKKLSSYGMPKTAIDKRILSQMIVTHVDFAEKNEIIREYIMENPESDLSKAVVYEQCVNYFVGRGKIDDAQIRYVMKLYLNGEELNKNVKLSFLKYYSQNLQRMDDDVRSLVVKFLKEQIDDRVFLSCFKEYKSASVFPDKHLFKKLESILEELDDRVIIDYVSSPGKLAKIHYIISGDKNAKDEYSIEPMREVCGGLCFKDFVLFFGETLEYYITEESDDEASLSDNGSIQRTDTAINNNKCRYELINEMIVSDTTKDYVRFDNLLEEYHEKEYLNSELFKLI